MATLPRYRLFIRRRSHLSADRETRLPPSGRS